MTRTSDQLTQRHTLLTAFAAAALMTAVGIAQAQSTTQGPRDASDSNAQNTQGLGQDSTRPGTARSDTGTMSQRSGSATGSSPATTTQTTPSASDTNRDASQGVTADRSTTGASGSGSMGSGSTAGSGTMSSGSTAGRSAATTTQTTPSADDTNREASQGMTADRASSGSMGSSSSASMGDSDLRNDRTTMARAPRADRN